MATLDEQIKSMDPQALEEINKYIDELKGQAQGDYDFIVKFLKKNFETALGTDDTQRAQFFANVANQLEQRIGRIPFDYETKTSREKEDIANLLRRAEIEDTDLRARQVEFEQQQQFQQQQQKQQTDEAYNAKGLLGSGIQKKTEQQQAQARQLEQAPIRRAFELERTRRNEQVGEAQLQSARNLQDITTEARRAGQDTQTGYEQGTEGAQRTLAQRLAEIARMGQAEKRSALSALQSEELFKRQNALL